MSKKARVSEQVSSVGSIKIVFANTRETRDKERRNTAADLELVQHVVGCSSRLPLLPASCLLHSRQATPGEVLCLCRNQNTCSNKTNTRIDIKGAPRWETAYRGGVKP